MKRGDLGHELGWNDVNELLESLPGEELREHVPHLMEDLRTKDGVRDDLSKEGSHGGLEEAEHLLFHRLELHITLSHCHVGETKIGLVRKRTSRLRERDTNLESRSR